MLVNTARRIVDGSRALLLFAAVALCGLTPAAHAAPGTPALIPLPQQQVIGAGVFVLDGDTALVAPDDARSREVAAFAREAIAGDNGVVLASRAGRGGKRIELTLDPAIQGEEAYVLEVAADRIGLSASHHRGLFWAVQTLRQLIRREGGLVSIPAMRIEDAPQFGYRGHMLDVGRHFMPVEFIKKQIDLLSYYKINTFRWHLTEDQGWRIEIKKYPKLTEVGAWRIEPDGSRHGGFYTQDQVREVVEYARLRNIMVIPEIEMPGHATAALAAYPHLSCRDEPVTVPNSWGVFADVFCVGKPGTFEFITDVLDEVIALFPAPYVHIGGDEVPKDRWRESADSQRLMREQGLKDEHELQSWFIRRVQAYLAGKGKTMIGWDEILEGGMDKDAIVEVWRGAEQGAKALANGNRIIVAGPFYLDSPGDALTLEKVYRTEVLDPAYRAHRAQVLGAEAPLWAEYVTTMNAEAMLYPRLPAFAEAAWTAAPPPRDYAGFRQRLQSHYRQLENWNVAYGPEDKRLVGYRLSWNPAARDWTLRAQRGFDDMRIHYTLDGSEPRSDSPSFTDALTIDKPGSLRAAPFRADRQALASQRFDIAAHLALGKPVTYSQPADPRYWQSGSSILADALFGGDNFGDGLWAGWRGTDLVATIDLEKVQPIQSIQARFLQQSGSWILLPKAVRYSVSSDGKHWTRLHARTFEVDAGDVRRVVEEVAFTAASPVAARYVRMEVESYGLLPEGHGGAGRPSYFFTDEIVVR